MDIIKTEIKILNKKLQNTFKSLPCNISDKLTDFIFLPSKRIRPSLVFFVANAMEFKISDEIYNLAAAVEIIHNATLIHDDIIDEANLRRGKVSLNVSLGNSLSVLYGDILLSVSMQLLSELKNIEIINLFSNTLNKMCQGEINQYFSLDKLPTIEEYITKSQNKTAELYAAALESLFIIENIQEQNKIRDFAINFGIAFQIKDDLINILKTDKSKPELSDINNGIYTLPVILSADKNNINFNSSKEEIIYQILNDTNSINKTKSIIKEYSAKAVSSLDFIENNKYKTKLIEITESLFQF